MEDRLHMLNDLGIDIEPTLKRFCGDTDLLLEMLHEFCAEGHDAKLVEARAAGNLAELEHVAHTAKGTSANLGLAELSGKCNEVVQGIRSGDTSNMEEKVADAAACYRALCTAMANKSEME